MTEPTILTSLPPGLILILAGALLPFLRGTARSAAILIAPVLMLAWTWLLPQGDSLAFDWLGLTLTPVRVDALSQLFATVFSIMAFAGGLFALKQERVLELAAAFIYAGGSIGVVFAGDLITVFVFWELMAVASTLVVVSNGADCTCRRTALHRHPSSRRRAADGRHRRTGRLNRLDRLRRHAAR